MDGGKQRGKRLSFLDIGAIEEEEKDIVKLTTRVLPVPM
jgi:hypothetical protein